MSGKPGFQLVGPALLRKLRPEMPVSLVAIGGITEANVAEVVQAGADVVAVISAVCAAPDPEAATRRPLGLIEEAAGRRGVRSSVDALGEIAIMASIFQPNSRFPLSGGT